MIKSNFLKKIHNAVTFCKTSTIFEPNLSLFQKPISQFIRFHRNGFTFSHLSKAVLKNKTVIVQLHFWEFKNHA